jgi:two-component system sensor histidine kinase BaeS
MTALDLHLLLVTCVVELEAMTRDRGISVDLQTDTGPAMVSADTIRLQQVFVNLLSNAVRYSPDGGAEFRVALPSEGASFEDAANQPAEQLVPSH